MKTKEIAKTYGFNREDFEAFCFLNHIKLSGFMGDTIDDSELHDTIERYKQYLIEKQVRETAREKQEKDKEKTTSQMCFNCTTTNDFANAQIEEYLGTVSGADVYLMGGIIGEGVLRQTQLFGKAFSNAKEKMFEEAVDLGANAIVGMSTTLTNVLNGNMIVVVTGTAVRIKKKEDINN